ncbi:flagellar basal body rod protein FlgC [Endozoicomonas montiporae]|uniref:Flagellar basal-body rod protein FlgC n=2 Tax=Endozoicomonas montiporae TaxID=1027273 RepID=A0A081NC71_9GAMM|nr:flagellar basal body rod protein FlgC [Endozoicomonas montiporae]AMO56375.1 flagellar basal-body rod protein FlgC [Endozoicomonas montiporae CL-33]KEQ16044.1 flagellar basal body rod protein FlgC [Endozoicomonas montiporae]
MSLNSIYDIAGSSLNAQTLRLNTIASNMANAETAAASPDAVYKARRPVFSEVMRSAQMELGSQVEVREVLQSQADPLMRYEPNNPLANEDGNVFYPNVNVVAEMADMMSATRNYQTSVEVMSNARRMQERLLSLGQ